MIKDLPVEQPYLEMVAEGIPDGARVWIVGGYQGRTTVALVEEWPEITFSVFEPQKWAYDQAVLATLKYPNIHNYNFGLANPGHAGSLPLGEWHTDAASMFHQAKERNWANGYGDFVDVKDIVPSNGDVIWLATINCEGGEFVLLPRLIETGQITQFKWLLIQWHAVYVTKEACDQLKMALNASHEIVIPLGVPADRCSWTLWRSRL